MSDFCGSYDWVKTRKEHKCSVCRRVFPKGSVMIRYSGKSEGDFYYGHQCFGCSAFVSFLIDTSSKETKSYEIYEYFYSDDWDQQDAQIYKRDFQNITFEEGLTHSSCLVRRDTQGAMAKI